MRRESGSGSRLPDFPRTKQAQEGLLFRVESSVAGADNAQMPRAEILDRSAVEIRIDHRGTDLRASRNGRGIPELPADAPHHRRYHLLRFALALRRTVLGKCDRREQRPAPRPEILRRELLAEVFAHVVVQARTGRVARAVVPDVSKESPAARKREQLVDLAGELVVDERPAHPCRRPAASTPVACSFAPGLGAIQTSFHAGGIARVDVAKTSAQPQAPPTPLPRHRLPLVSATVQNKTIVVLEGDETGEELLEESRRVRAPDGIGLELELPRFDLSLEARRDTQNAVVHEAARAIRELGFGLKAATITPEGRDDVGSPNRILREEIGGRVIVRTGRRIP